MALGGGVGCAVVGVPQPMGSVLCWGAIGSWFSPPLPDSEPIRPTAISGVDDAVELVVGEPTCARTRSGEVWCWGRESGSYDRTNRIATAHRVAGIEDAHSLSLSGSTACAVEGHGTVMCWGDNFQGQVGDGTRMTRPHPMPVDLPFEALGVSVGRHGACAWSNEGRIACWGSDLSGHRPARRPEIAGELPGLVKLIVREDSSCGLLRDGTVVCSNSLGPSGAEPPFTTIDDQRAWVIAGVTDAVDLAASDGFACALRRSGHLRCWGGRASVPRPTLAPIPRNVPQDLDRAEEVVAVAAGDDALCARRPDGRIECWGKNDRGQLGDGGERPRIDPVLVPLPGEPLPPAPLLPLAASSCKRDQDCGWILARQSVRCDSVAGATLAPAPADITCTCADNLCTSRPGPSVPTTPVACLVDQDCITDRASGTCDTPWPQDPRAATQSVRTTGPTCTCRENTCHWAWMDPVPCTRDSDCWSQGGHAIRRPAAIHGRFRPCVDGEQVPACAAGICVLGHAYKC